MLGKLPARPHLTPNRFSQEQRQLSRVVQGIRCRRAYSAVMFRTVIVLVLERAPLLISTELGDTSSKAAINFRQASLALPSTGGAAIFIFNMPSRSPTSSSRGAPG